MTVSCGKYCSAGISGQTLYYDLSKRMCNSSGQKLAANRSLMNSVVYPIKDVLVTQPRRQPELRAYPRTLMEASSGRESLNDQTVLGRALMVLDWAHIRRQIKPLTEAKESPEILQQLDQIVEASNG